VTAKRVKKRPRERERRQKT